MTSPSLTIGRATAIALALQLRLDGYGSGAAALGLRHFVGSPAATPLLHRFAPGGLLSRALDRSQSVERALIG
jgi:hypothetical protein